MRYLKGCKRALGWVLAIAMATRHHPSNGRIVLEQVKFNSYKTFFFKNGYDIRCTSLDYFIKYLFLNWTRVFQIVYLKDPDWTSQYSVFKGNSFPVFLAKQFKEGKTSIKSRSTPAVQFEQAGFGHLYIYIYFTQYIILVKKNLLHNSWLVNASLPLMKKKAGRSKLKIEHTCVNWSIFRIIILSNDWSIDTTWLSKMANCWQQNKFSV